MERHRLDALFTAVADAQRKGGKQSRRRTGTIGNRELEGAPLRWVEVTEPPVVYLPDAHPGDGWSSAAMTVCFVLAFLGLVAAIISIAESDWLFAAIFASAMVLLGFAGLRLDGRAARAREGIETLGLYLTPDALVVRRRKDVVIAPRNDVRRFQVRQRTPTQTSGVRFSEFVELVRDGTITRIDLQRGQHHDQRSLCEAWREGAWPPPLPRA